MWSAISTDELKGVGLSPTPCPQSTSLKQRHTLLNEDYILLWAGLSRVGTAFGAFGAFVGLIRSSAQRRGPKTINSRKEAYICTVMKGRGMTLEAVMRMNRSHISSDLVWSGLLKYTSHTSSRGRSV